MAGSENGAELAESCIVAKRRHPSAHGLGISGDQNGLDFVSFLCCLPGAVVITS
jgi:hypothetical protein